MMSGRKGGADDEIGDGYVNHTRQKILPASSRFMSADQVAAELGISRAGAYAAIRKINQDLQKKGFLTFSGRILKSVWIERTGGV